MLGRLPSHLQSFDSNNSETVVQSLRLQPFDGGVSLSNAVERLVNTSCHDEGAPNMKAERHLRQ
eukprot:1086085-Pyramimonas_sp.AAC.1